jgi:hypothetical protein
MWKQLKNPEASATSATSLVNCREVVVGNRPGHRVGDRRAERSSAVGRDVASSRSVVDKHVAAAGEEVRAGDGHRVVVAADGVANAARRIEHVSIERQRRSGRRRGRSAWGEAGE